jgi:hypothetical protein
MPGVPLELTAKPDDEGAEQWRSGGGGCGGAADESARIGMPGFNTGVIVIQEGVEAGIRYGKPAGKPFSLFRAYEQPISLRTLKQSLRRRSTCASPFQELGERVPNSKYEL